MDTYTTETSIQSPTNVIRPVDTSPQQIIKPISEADFKRFVPSGWKVEMDLPLKKTTNQAIFGINIDGYMPYWNLSDSFYPTALRNLAPVQICRGAMEFVRVYHEQVTVPAMTYYMSHRAFAGNVKIGIRIQSNTTQSGSFIVSQASTVARNYYKDSATYEGLAFMNSSTETIDYAVNSFVIGDLSINRNWSITPMAQPTLPVVDLSYKLARLNELCKKASPSVNYLKDMEVFAHQFTEDWLLFAPQADLPNQNSNQLVMEIFFDYSNIQFYTPLPMFISSTNALRNKQILRVSETINHKQKFDKKDALFRVEPVVTVPLKTK